MRFLILTIPLFTVLWTLPALADIYKWVDENGTVHFSDTPPATEGEVETVDAEPAYVPDETEEVEPESEQGESGSTDSGVSLAKLNTVDLYVTNWCPYCRKAEDYFRARGIEFTAYNVDTDREARQRKFEMSGRSGVPFAVVNGVRIRGFDPAGYQKALY